MTRTSVLSLPEEQSALDALGVQYLYPYQRLLVSNILEAFNALSSASQNVDRGGRSDRFEAHRNQIAILPTGAGKSLCFQLPAVLLPGPTIVVFPLLSLIADQERRLKAGGTCTCVLRGNQSPEERRKVLQLIGDGHARIILTNPETLCTERTIELLRNAHCSHLVIDEAHCVSEWGETFRPAYLELPQAIARINVPLVTAFTATASQTILDAVHRILFNGESVNVVRANPDRQNISYRVLTSVAPLHTLYSLLRPRVSGTLPEESGPAQQQNDTPLYPEYLPVRRPALIFCRTRRRAELVAEYLRRRLPPDDIYFYHAGLTREEKNRIEAWFFDSTNGILSSTCAYGLGVDKANIRTVIHFDTPPSVEAYLQESGRGGRDRNHAEALLISRLDGSPELQFSGTAAAADRALRMMSYAHSSGCRRSYLMEQMGAEPETCFGCDLCRETAGAPPEGMREILWFIRYHPRRYSRSEAARELSSTLLTWQEEDIEFAIRLLERCGLVRVYRRGPWKHLLGCGGRGTGTLDPVRLKPV